MTSRTGEFFLHWENVMETPSASKLIASRLITSRHPMALAE